MSLLAVSAGRNTFGAEVHESGVEGRRYTASATKIYKNLPDDLTGEPICKSNMRLLEFISLAENRSED